MYKYLHHYVFRFSVAGSGNLFVEWYRCRGMERFDSYYIPFSMFMEMPKCMHRRNPACYVQGFNYISEPPEGNISIYLFIFINT